eukprot:CAMPEP_0117566312 /NCGR_PEP_ID=MMETSP0784-20121206/57028_1 /TAXON_ID=39447 /ORGANISM="" /LENGTH=431 /DNA_ID=CAMNT_0005364151 /DNA_START=70 /DNA_END=1365 /DNA_ORIENTATION=-
MASGNTRALTFFLIVAMLTFGSYNTVNTKLQDQTCAPTLDTISMVDHPDCPAGKKLFAKPWLQNVLMFVGEASMLVVYGATKKRKHTASATAAAGGGVTPDGGNGLLEPTAAGTKTPFYIFAIPAFCDVFGTGLASVAMLLLDSAIWQMLRSAIIIFSAIISVCFLKKRLQPFHWVATGIVFVGLIIVSLANTLDAGDGSSTATSPAKSLLGVALVIAAQVCAAFQMCFEEMLLTGRATTSAKRVVGWEGVWGLFYMTIMLTIMNYMSGPDAGHYEWFSDGVHMITHQPGLFFLCASYMVSISVYNLVGITVGKKMSAVVRCLVDSCRTIVVWLVNIVLYYFVSPQYGAAWKAHTWLTVVGFMVLVVGTLLYNEVLPPPECLQRPLDTPTDSTLPHGTSGSFVDGVYVKVDLTDEGEGRSSTAREVQAQNA